MLGRGSVRFGKAKASAEFRAGGSTKLVIMRYTTNSGRCCIDQYAMKSPYVRVDIRISVVRVIGNAAPGRARGARVSRF